MKKVITIIILLSASLVGISQSNPPTDYMLLIYSEPAKMTKLEAHEQQAHIQKIGGFINELAAQGKLTGAQPLLMEGMFLKKKEGEFNEEPFSKDANRVVAGYYLIKAENLSAAISIAKSDPRFEDESWSMEIRPIMKIEGIN